MTSQSSRKDSPKTYALAIRRIGAGYVVVATFLVSFFLLRYYDAELSFNEKMMMALLISAPLIVAAAAEWLKDAPISGLRVGLTTLEITLDKSSTSVPALMTPELENALASEAHASDKPFLTQWLPRLATSFAARLEEAVSLNLEPAGKTIPYWWSTRLFLVAAILNDFTRVQTIYFVDGGERRRYFGRVATIELRSRLNNRCPELDHHYRSLTQRKLAIVEIIDQWGMVGFTVDDEWKSEENYMERLGSAELKERLGAALDSSSIDRSEFRGPELIYQILTWESNQVPVTIGGRLDRVVDNRALAKNISVTALGQVKS